MITILGKDFPIYGLLCTLGIVVAAFVAFFLAKKSEKTKMDFFDFVIFGIYILIGSVLGSKILFLIVSMGDIVHAFKVLGFSWDLLSGVLLGGWVFYGGFIGGVAALLIYARVYKKDLRSYANFAAVVLPLGHGFGRIGCFFGGCCYGMEYDGWLSYTYKTPPLNATTPVGVPLFPVQLVEAFFLFLLFAVLLLLFLKNNPSFDCWLVYLGAYAVLRFVLEFFRGDKERGVALISTSQWISVVMLAAAIGIWIWKWRKGKYKFEIATVDETETSDGQVTENVEE